MNSSVSRQLSGPKNGCSIVTSSRAPGSAPPRGGGRGFENAPLRTADAWVETLRRQRHTLFDRVRAADPAGRLDVTIEHPFFGPLNWRETLLFTRLHDLDHAGQLGKIAVAFGVTPSA